MSKPTFTPSTTTQAPTQPAPPSFAFNADKPTPAVKAEDQKPPGNPFTNLLSAKPETAAGTKPRTESSPFKAAFTGNATTPAQVTSTISGTAATSNAPPPSFAFNNAKATEASAPATSTTPQKGLPAFSGFAPQPQGTKPAEPLKSSTPPGSPDQPATFSQAPVGKVPGQPTVSGAASRPSSASVFAPAAKPSVSFSGPAKQPAAGVPPSVPKPLPPKPPQPKRDRLLDFTRWFVRGDEGLMSEFQQHFLEGLLTPLFLEWEQKEEEKRRREEEARNNAVADKFRQRSLSVRYFYKWKTNAREKRLKFLRRSGREQLKNFYRAQQTASRIPQAAPKTTPEAPPVPRPSHEQALMESLRKSQAKRRYMPPPSSGSLEVMKSRDSAAAIGRHFNLPMPQSETSSPARSRSSSMSKGGSKTRALREELLGMSTGRFRRSLPSIASSEDSSPESVRSSKVSERWRLKAMGIVQLPDGTAVPESLMNDRRFNSYSRSHRASSITSVPSRRPSNSGSRRPSISIPPPPAFSSTNRNTAILEDGTSNKRKRTSEDSIGLMGQDDDLPINNHKRVMSDAENLVKELRALREEMEEGTMWFQSQNKQLHAEISSRGGTPMDDSI